MHSPAPFPLNRPRRLRRDAFTRALVRETRLGPEDLILPVFILVLPGVIAYSLSNGTVTGDRAYAWMVTTLLPPGIKGLVVAGLLAALMSSLAALPLKQSLAVTGSVNQLGQVQAIGGVNEKIEGFFRTCRRIGLTGTQGVVIPAANVRNLALHPEVIEAVRALPNVESAEAINILPMNGRGAGMSFDLEGAEPLPPGRYRMAEYGIVSPGYFETMRIPLRQGRHLTPADDGQHQVAMVNEAFVRRYLPGANPLGRRIRQHTGQTNWVEIVGVVGDVKDSGLGRNTQPAIYQPFTQTCCTPP